MCECEWKSFPHSGFCRVPCSAWNLSRLSVCSFLPSSTSLRDLGQVLCRTQNELFVCPRLRRRDVTPMTMMMMMKVQANKEEGAGPGSVRRSPRVGRRRTIRAPAPPRDAQLMSREGTAGFCSSWLRFQVDTSCTKFHQPQRLLFCVSAPER